VKNFQPDLGRGFGLPFRGTDGSAQTFPSMWINRLLTSIGVATSHPLALLVVALYVALWLIFDRGSLNWHAVGTVATLVMTLFI
jgi:hypothetical protein